MKRLLVLSYYFPPLGMSGVQRTLKFVKYLPQFGWHPVVITPDHRGSYGHDPALLDEIPATRIVRTFSLDPLYLSPRRPDPRAINHHRRAIAAVSAACVPDNKVGWIPFAVNAGLAAARQGPVAAVFSSAPPYSSHLAALVLARALSLPLIVDYRDAWSQDNPLSHLPTAAHRRIQLALERMVSRRARLTIAINQEILDGLRSNAGGDLPGCVVPHGFDPDDFAGPPPPVSPIGFTLAYSGTFIGDRDPVVLARAVADLRSRRPDLAAGLRVEIAGAHRPQDRRAIAGLGVADAFTFHSFLPHHRSVALMRQADALWLIIGAGEGSTVSTGKLYEYLGARRPIIASVPDHGAAAAIVRETSSGVIVDPGDHRRLSAVLEQLMAAKAAGRDSFRPAEAALARYDRKDITRRLAGLLDRCRRASGTGRAGHG